MLVLYSTKPKEESAKTSPEAHQRQQQLKARQERAKSIRKALEWLQTTLSPLF
ncbi:hypothetical protein [Candidatus Odyssella acanthamoebae]|uniref:hypothetical protein n=1 Tax=Candidatus Odyssella acanthamoebae TaxID=91604 RepID=UPI001E4C59DD|nr:hypothetical protein [Candidatus Paracaedibacter acanthamoebae]